MSTSSLSHWLTLRVRFTCILVLLVGSLLPPYIPKAALAPPEMEQTSSQYLLVEEGFLMKTSAISRQGTRRAFAEGIIHTVKSGESLEKLANRYDISVDTIRRANKLEEGRPINPGDELLILPVNGVLHTVSRGQTVNRIAQLYDVSVQSIIDQNDLGAGYILTGQEIIIPGGHPIVGKPTEIAHVESPPISTTRVQVPAEKVEPKPPAPDRGFSQEDITVGVLQKPCSAACFYTQYYRSGHYAVDMQERGGGPIFAAEAGTVIRADYGWNGGFGNVIEIDHGNGLVTLYAHNKELYVSVGDNVARGQNISWMGNTGLVYGATGIHVHFEVRLNGVKKNPLLYLQ